MDTLKTGKRGFFEVTSQKYHKLIYKNDNQSYSDNKYLNKLHNIIKDLSGTLNYQRKTKKVMDKRLLYPGFKNGQVHIK